jgi:hypothetical protein
MCILIECGLMIFFLGAKSVHMGLPILYGFILLCLHPFEVWLGNPMYTIAKMDGVSHV